MSMKVRHGGRAIVHSNVWGQLFRNHVCRWTWTLEVQLAVGHKAAVAGDFWFFDLFIYIYIYKGTGGLCQ